MNAYIARQPIFDRDQKIAGYELFYRNSSGNAARVTNGNDATRRVLTDAVTLFGILELTNDRPAFITFTPNLILDDFVLKADPEIVLIQVMADTRINDTLEAKLRTLKEAGYALVLKNYTGQRHLHDYLNLFDIIRVNFRVTSSPLQKTIRYNHGRPDTQFIADQIENYDNLYKATNTKYHFFQGFYWGRPEMISIPVPPLLESAYGQILSVLHQARFSLTIRWDIECAKIIEGHLLLSYLFQREINSVLDTLPKTREEGATDASHVARLMGPPAMKHWTWLAYMLNNNITDDEDLPRRAYLRGLFMEELAKNSELNVDLDSGNVFLLGVLSMIEEIVGESPTYLLRGLPLLSAASSQEQTAYSLLLRYAKLYEANDPKTPLPDIRCSLDSRQISIKYRLCAQDADAAVARMESTI